MLHCGAKLASQRGGIGKLPCSRMCNAAIILLGSSTSATVLFPHVQCSHA